jgi:hypothetical protein
MVIYGQIQCGVVLFPRQFLALLIDLGKMIETVTVLNRKQLKASERKRDAQPNKSEADRLGQQQQQQQRCVDNSGDDDDDDDDADEAGESTGLLSRRHQRTKKRRK